MTSIARHRHRGLIMTSYETILTRRDMVSGRTNFGYFSRQKSPRCSLGGGAEVKIFLGRRYVMLDLKDCALMLHYEISLSASSDIPSTICFNTQPQLWHILINKLARLTPQTNSTCRKLRTWAFQRYRGLGVSDRVFLGNNASVRSP